MLQTDVDDADWEYEEITLEKVIFLRCDVLLTASVLMTQLLSFIQTSFTVGTLCIFSTVGGTRGGVPEMLPMPHLLFLLTRSLSITHKPRFTWTAAVKLACLFLFNEHVLELVLEVVLILCDICRAQLGSDLALLAAQTALMSAMIQVYMSQRSLMVERQQLTAA